MDNSINQQQIFNWAIQLTSQPDYHALTYYFLDLLEHLPGVDQVFAYEIYGGSKRKTGEASSVSDQLIRRFPLELSEENDEETSELLAELNTAKDFTPGQADAEGFVGRVIACIREVSGPNRALLVLGKLSPPQLELLDNLICLYRNQVALHDSKERDTLTKLPNRQSFDRRLMQVCEFFLRHPITDTQQNKSSWLAILDIDHFKRINDTFGHLYGDEVLLIFSQLMEKHFRFNDFLFRFGGEEFVVILNLVNQANAEATFERFRNVVAEHEFPTVGQVTISIGLVHIDSAIMPSTLLDRADQAMYYAKNHGRNQLRIYQPGDGHAAKLTENHEPDLF